MKARWKEKERYIELVHIMLNAISYELSIKDMIAISQQMVYSSWTNCIWYTQSFTGYWNYLKRTLLLQNTFFATILYGCICWASFQQRMTYTNIDKLKYILYIIQVTYNEVMGSWGNIWIWPICSGQHINYHNELICNITISLRCTF